MGWTLTEGGSQWVDEPLNLHYVNSIDEIPQSVRDANPDANYSSYRSMRDRGVGDWWDGGGFVGVLAAAVGGLAAAGAGAGAMTASELAAADIALGGAGGSAGGAALGSAGAGAGGSWISQMVDSATNAISNFTSGGEAFNPSGWMSGVESSISPIAESGGWGANAIGEAGSAAGTAMDGAYGAVADSVASDVATSSGISSTVTPTEFLNQQVTNGPGFTPADSYAQAYPGSSIPGGSGLDMPQASPGGSNYINDVLKWGKENQGIVSGAMQLGGGLLKGMGDSAVVAEKMKNDSAMLDRKLAAEAAIASARTPEAMQAALRQQAATSGAFGQRLGFGPGTQRTLRRPDGSFVYAQPGIVAGAMR